MINRPESIFITHQEFTITIAVIFTLLVIVVLCLAFYVYRLNKTKSALKETDKALRLSLDAAKAGTWTWDVSTDEVIFDERLEKIFGLQPGTFNRTFQGWKDRVHPDDVQLAEQTTLEALNNGTHYECEYRVKGFSGDWRIVNAQAATLVDNSGRPVRMSGFATDITERKLAETELKNSQELLSEVTHQLPGVIYQFYARPNGEMGLYYLSEKAEQVAGLKPDLDGFFERFTELIVPEHRESFIKSIEQAIEEIRPWHFEGVFQKPTGERVIFSSVSSPSERENEIVYNGIILDITEQKQAEEEQRQLEAQFQQAQKMESVGRLAGGVAHDFNNMLSVIIGHAELSMEQLDQDNPLFDEIKTIRNAAERSADITRQLLTFARKQTVTPRVLDLNETVAGMIKMLKRLIGEDIDIAWLPEAGVWPVKMDASQIDQILANLCVNARDAIDGQGRITIETKNAAFDEAYCAQHIEAKTGDFVMLAVSDNGHGMDKETLEKIFEPFFTTKTIDKGTGLGLATVYGIAKQNNGFINVYSELGYGTTFKIYLPRHSADTANPQTKSRTTQELAQGNETILLVEDDLAILNMAKRSLKRLGYHVLALSTPGEALQEAKKHAGKIHLLITDVIMPEMNGKELAKELVSLFPKFKILFMSGYTADIIAHHGVLNEGINFIEKPFSLQKLAASVREVLDSQC